MISPELSDGDFKRFSSLVYEKCGINLHEGKKELVRARLAKRLREGGFGDFRAYYDFLADDNGTNELVRMLDAISTNLTSFFREEKHFHYLQEKVFPTYGPTTGRRLRFWSAGCSSGEEPYTLGLCLLDYFGERPSFDIKILASDLSTKVLAKAQSGVYPQERMSKVPISMARKYFQQGVGAQQGNCRVKKLLRDLIVFKRFNLMDPFPFKEVFHVVFCRNVMIYFDKTTQQRLIQKFWECLVPGGYLFIGHSESLTGIDHRFSYLMPSAYQKK